jgi:hypothetical protein
MEHEGMVHALVEIGRLLRRDGTLIDIHPCLEAPFIKVFSGGVVSFAEPDPSYDYEDDLQHAEEALAAAVQLGAFSVDRSREFDFLTYASSVSELRDFLTESGAYDERPQDDDILARQGDVYARAEDVMKASAETTNVGLHERGRMTRLRPMT